MYDTPEIGKSRKQVKKHSLTPQIFLQLELASPKGGKAIDASKVGVLNEISSEEFVTHIRVEHCPDLLPEVKIRSEAKMEEKEEEALDSKDSKAKEPKSPDDVTHTGRHDHLLEPLPQELFQQHHLQAGPAENKNDDEEETKVSNAPGLDPDIAALFDSPSPSEKHKKSHSSSRKSVKDGPHRSQSMRQIRTMDSPVESPPSSSRRKSAIAAPPSSPRRRRRSVEPSKEKHRSRSCEPTKLDQESKQDNDTVGKGTPHSSRRKLQSPPPAESPKSPRRQSERVRRKSTMSATTDKPSRPHGKPSRSASVTATSDSAMHSSLVMGSPRSPKKSSKRRSVTATSPAASAAIAAVYATQ